MSLAASGQAGHAVTRRAARFLEASARGSGAWPIDSDLSSWVTTLSVKALAAAGLLEPALSEAERMKLAEELVSRQYREVHPYTGASPGGWAWTDLPGGVPDADDTAGALLALRLLAPDSAAARRAAARGLCWLLDLQNRDGGLPTFCRGWGKLPFDRSGADLTAHALSAFLAWAGDLGGEAGLDARRIERAARRAIAYLREAQNAGGSWTPLWFGNERAPGFENRTYGTARVVGALEDAAARGLEVDDLLYRGRSWLRAAQNPDGGWGGAAGVESSVEETALAVAALASRDERKREDSLRENLRRGAAWLVEAVESGAIDTPSPIGFYFANLWYHEKLYPWIFTLEALGRMQQDSRV
jgi:squalene-hopene/tetraprenyl-beta-curcumene cyclase